MDRKATAKETVRILHDGYYDYQGQIVSLKEAHQQSINASHLITIEDGKKILDNIAAKIPLQPTGQPQISVCNQSAVDAVWSLSKFDDVAVLNFASAKNPGGGFLNGAMAQEESLATASGLYDTLLANEIYYTTNRQNSSMMYSDLAIFSPNVVFFRDGKFNLLAPYTTASVLTIPAVNYGQVLLKKEDAQQAKNVMQHRMRLVLAILAAKGCSHIILGAYGCGVFRNDPQEVAKWWRMLLAEGYGTFFTQILFAVFDNSKTQATINAFYDVFGH